MSKMNEDSNLLEDQEFIVAMDMTIETSETEPLPPAAPPRVPRQVKKPRNNAKVGPVLRPRSRPLRQITHKVPVVEERHDLVDDAVSERPLSRGSPPLSSVALEMQNDVTPIFDDTGNFVIDAEDLRDDLVVRTSSCWSRRQQPVRKCKAAESTQVVMVEAWTQVNLGRRCQTITAGEPASTESICFNYDGFPQETARNVMIQTDRISTPNPNALPTLKKHQTLLNASRESVIQQTAAVTMKDCGPQTRSSTVNAATAAKLVAGETESVEKIVQRDSPSANLNIVPLSPPSAVFIEETAEPSKTKNVIIEERLQTSSNSELEICEVLTFRKEVYFPRKVASFGQSAPNVHHDTTTRTTTVSRERSASTGAGTPSTFHGDASASVGMGSTSPAVAGPIPKPLPKTSAPKAGAKPKKRFRNYTGQKRPLGRPRKTEAEKALTTPRIRKRPDKSLSCPVCAYQEDYLSMMLRHVSVDHPETAAIVRSKLDSPYDCHWDELPKVVNGRIVSDKPTDRELKIREAQSVKQMLRLADEKHYKVRVARTMAAIKDAYAMTAYAPTPVEGPTLTAIQDMVDEEPLPYPSSISPNGSRFDDYLAAVASGVDSDSNDYLSDVQRLDSSPHCQYVPVADSEALESPRSSSSAYFSASDSFNLDAYNYNTNPLPNQFSPEDDWMDSTDRIDLPDQTLFDGYPAFTSRVLLYADNPDEQEPIEEPTPAYINPGQDGNQRCADLEVELSQFIHFRRKRPQSGSYSAVRENMLAEGDYAGSVTQGTLSVQRGGSADATLQEDLVSQQDQRLWQPIPIQEASRRENTGESALIEDAGHSFELEERDTQVSLYAAHYASAWQCSEQHNLLGAQVPFPNDQQAMQTNGTGFSVNVNAYARGVNFLETYNFQWDSTTQMEVEVEDDQCSGELSDGDLEPAQVLLSIRTIESLRTLQRS